MLGKTNAGGGIALNFKVVGGTVQTSNPKENTIWVETGTYVTGCEFSDDAPAVPAEGMVWIVTGPASANTFNALKAGGMSFCSLSPIMAKQYINGAWEDKGGRIYQGGVWNELWNGVLYDYGDQCEFITGGWVGSQTISSNTTSGGKLTVNADNLSFTNVSGGSFGVVTAKAVNLSGFNTLHAITTGSTRIQVASAFPTSSPVVYSEAFSGASTEHTVDISKVAGEYKIAINNRGADGAAKVFRVWLT